VGVVRGKNLPGTDELNESVCYFRDALALDERRVKFLPEYICGGESYDPTIVGNSLTRVNDLLKQRPSGHLVSAMI
jgi:Uncharacterized alpha/beta hydrolase domain (DUF2235)